MNAQQPWRLYGANSKTFFSQQFRHTELWPLIPVQRGQKGLPKRFIQEKLPPAKASAGAVRQLPNSNWLRLLRRALAARCNRTAQAQIGPFVFSRADPGHVEYPVKYLAPMIRKKPHTQPGPSTPTANNRVLDLAH